VFFISHRERRERGDMYLDMMNKMDMMPTDRRDAVPIILDMMNRVFEILSDEEAQRVQRSNF